MAYIPFPTGTILTFGGSVAPDGWLLCDGSVVSRSTYARLFSVLSTTYGSGDGSSTFALPDLRGVYPRGAETNGTTNYGGVAGHTPAGGVLGSKGGQKTAKNGLGSSASSISLTMNSSSLSSLSLNNNNASHNHAQNYTGRNGFGNFGVVDAPSFRNRIMVAADETGGYYATSTNNQSANHSHSLSSGTAAAQTLSSGSASAQTISGDTETTPAFLAVNYIIKL